MVNAGVISDFTVSSTSGTAPLTVSFTDQSSGSPTGWAWFFGDETYTQAWTQQTASAGWSQRSEHKSVAMADGSIVFMGGYDGTISKNDVWRSTNNGTTWTRINASPGWSARHSHSSVVMPDNSIILTGGWDGNFRNDVWRSTDNGMTWSLVTANAGWTARAGHNSVALPDGTIVIFGGNTDGGYKNDVWQSANNGLTWTQRTASAAWTAREDPSSVVMADGSIVLMGGQDSSGYRNDVWRSTDKGAGWTQVKGSTDWAGRWRHNTVVMPDGSIVLLGGRSDSNIYNDVWRSTDAGSTWTRLTSAAGWSGRSGPSSVVIPDGSLILMGGNPNNAHINDVWRFTPTGSSAQSPSHTYTATGTYPVTLQAYNKEGFNRTRKTGLITVTLESAPVANFTTSKTSGTVPMTVQFNDTSTGNPTMWNWSFGDGKWFNTTNVLLRNATSIYTFPGTYTVRLMVANTAGINSSTRTDYIIVRSPKPGPDFSADVTSGFAPLTVSFTDQSSGSPTGWAWFFGDETYTQAWTQQTASAGWSARFRHSSVVMPDGSIVLMGGLGDGVTTSDVWRSSDMGVTWVQVTSGTEVTARYDQSSVVMPDGSIVLMAGRSSNGWQMADVWRSVDYGATWTQMTGYAEWQARVGQSSVVMPDGSIVLMGGHDGRGYRNDTWRSTDNGATWTQMTPNAEWSARYLHSSVAMPDGSVVLMGGYDEHYDMKNDVWRSVDYGATWTQMTPNAEWSARYLHRSVVMPDGSIVLMGGRDQSESPKNDVWRSVDKGATWTPLNISSGWMAREGHTSVAMPDGSIVILGGLSQSSYKNDVWRFMPTGSSAQNPSHTYTVAGTYPVTLQAYNSGGFNSTRKGGYIRVNRSGSGSAPFQTIAKGDPVFIGESGLNVTGAVESGSYISWYASGAQIGGTPTKTIIVADSTNFFVNPADFSGFTGTWYAGRSSEGAFTVVDPTINVAIWDIDQNKDVSGTTVPTGDRLIFRIDTNAYPATSRPFVNAINGYVGINLSDSAGNSITQVYNLSPSESGSKSFDLTKRFLVNSQPWYWGNANDKFWNTSSSTNGARIYPEGIYSVGVRLFLNNISENYKSGNADYWGKTYKITTITLGPSSAAPVADFDVNATSGRAPLTVRFVDNSTNSPTSWNWSFGDGGISPEKNPTHTFGAAGIYTVNLTAGNSAGNTTVTKAGLITVAEAGVDSANEQVTVNTTILLKGNSFQVTAEGKANANYYLIIENASVTNTLLPVENYPAIVPNQNKVNTSPAATQEILTSLSTWSFMGEPITATDGTMAIITTNNTGKRTIVFTTSSPTKDYTFVLLLFRKSTVISGMYEIAGQEHVTVRPSLPPALTSGEAQVTSTQTGKSEYVVNGDRVAWTDTRSGYPEIYLLNRTTGTELRITQADSGKSTPVLARDLIVWTDYRNGQPAIYGYSPDSRAEFRIGSGYYPSKDKDRLVYQDSRNNALGVYLFNLTTGQETLLNHSQNPNQPKISGDIVVWYLQNSGYGRWQFEIYNLTTGARNQLPVTMSDWSYSLNGDRLAYVRDNQVYVYNISTGTESQITHTMSYKNEATLSGSLLAWGDTRNGQTDIYWTDLVSPKEQPGCLDTAAQYAPQISDNDLFWMDFRFGTPEILSSGIASGHSGQSPVADFTANKTSGIAPMTVLFTDTSTGSPAEWFWDFGDGSTSAQQNATHTYASAGIYTVSLMSKNTIGSNLATKPDYITVTAAPSPTLTGITPSGGVNTGAVAVTDLKGSGFAVGAIVDLVREGYAPINATDVVVVSPTRITCSFNLTGAATGLWEVAVTNPGAFTEAKSMFTVTAAAVKPVAAFSADVTSGTAPLTVMFTDASTNSPTSWNWTFGDGNTVNSSAQNPVHTYQTAGTYTVNLTAENSGGNSTVSKTRYITVTSAGPACTVPDQYATIQAAVNAANPGDTITVRSGVYNEHVVIAKSVSLVGVPSNGQNRPVINGIGSGIPVTVTANHVSLSGFIAVNSSDAGILLKANNTLVENITSLSNVLDGIRLDPRSSFNTLRNVNASSNQRHGILLLESASNNTLENSTVVSNQAMGMYLWYVANNNMISHVIFDRNNRGVLCQGNIGNEFSSITATHNTEYGFQFWDGANNNRLSDSFIVDNQFRGIFLFDRAHDNIITNTTITGNNEWAGFEVYQSSNNLIYNNYFNNARNYMDQEGSGSSSVNIWNVTPTIKTNIIGGPVTAGNYWADLWNTGFSQTNADTNNDGICDAPFTPGGQNRDSLPLHTYTPKTPAASFSANSTLGTVPLTVLFSDTSAGFPTLWLWDFGDGTTSTQRNVAHTFTTAGAYTINLTAANVAGSNTAVKTNYIAVTSVTLPPVAAFRANRTEGDRPLTVKFIDASSNTPVSWTWDFGDNNSSAEQNPVHQYILVGNYTVNLTATNSAGSNSTLKTRYIIVIAPVVESNHFTVSEVQTVKVGPVQNVSIDIGSANVTQTGNVVTISNTTGFSSLQITLAANTTQSTTNTTVSGTVEAVKAVTEPVTVPIESVGTPTVQIALNMTEMPAATAAITQTITKEPDTAAQTSFTLAASTDGKQIDDIAYTLNIVKTNLANAGDGGIIQSATLTMTVSPAWIADHGGIDHIVVMRKADDGTTQMLIPQQTGIDADGNIILSVYSPKGLSIFMLAAVSASHTSDSSGSTTSYSSGYTSSSDTGPAPVKSSAKTEMRAPIDPNSYPWTTQTLNGPTHITQIELQPMGTFKDLFILTEKPDTLPADIPTLGAPVYELHKIDLYHATSDNINQAKIGFTVSKSYLDSQKMTFRDVQLMRYHDKSWEKLPTEYLGTNGGDYQYRATTAGFSYFATVLVKDAAIVPATPSPTSLVPASTPQTSVQAKSTTVPTIARTQAAPLAPAAGQSPGIPSFLYILGIAGAAVVGFCVFIIYRWQVRRQNPSLFEDTSFWKNR